MSLKPNIICLFVCFFRLRLSSVSQQVLHPLWSIKYIAVRWHIRQNLNDNLQRVRHTLANHIFLAVSSLYSSCIRNETYNQSITTSKWKAITLLLTWSAMNTGDDHKKE